MLTTVVEIQSKNAMHLSVQTSVSILVSLRSALSAAKEAHITSQNATQCAIPLPCLAPWNRSTDGPGGPCVTLSSPFLLFTQIMLWNNSRTVGWKLVQWACVRPAPANQIIARFIIMMTQFMLFQNITPLHREPVWKTTKFDHNSKVEVPRLVWKPYDDSCFSNRAGIRTGDRGITLLESDGFCGNVMYSDFNLVILRNFLQTNVFRSLKNCSYLWKLLVMLSLPSMTTSFATDFQAYELCFPGSYRKNRLWCYLHDYRYLNFE